MEGGPYCHSEGGELVEFVKKPVEVHNYRKTTDYCRGIYGIYLKLINSPPTLSDAGH